ncbi:MAG TPA: right-handed parallel beta-helix repeat-containing protein [Mucilaginibacter sp.]|nr:right-handed parallel beta-helix repeat-containing protein [Mucilaginibacter sp.]
MKTLTKVTLVFLLFSCKLVYSQNDFTYRSVPASLTSKVAVSDGDRAKTIANTPNLYDLTQSLPAGFVRNGSVDYTDYLQKAINANQNVIFPDFPVLVNSKGIVLKSNMIVIFAKNSKLILQPTETDNYQVIRMYNTKNTKLYYPYIVGDREGHLGHGGEAGMGISIRGGSDNEVYNAHITNCWGDGIFFGDLTKNITLYSPFLDNNRRNGISIVWADGIKIYNMLSTNTNGTAPMAGIDIEPDDNTQHVDNILLQNPVTFNNKIRGILFAFKNFTGKANQSVNIDINNHKDIGSNIGVAFYLGAKKEGSVPVLGNIKFTNPDWSGSKKPMYMDPDMDNNGVNLRISGSGSNAGNLKRLASKARNVQFDQ